MSPHTENQGHFVGQSESEEHVTADVIIVTINITELTSLSPASLTLTPLSLFI